MKVRRLDHVWTAENLGSICKLVETILLCNTVGSKNGREIVRATKYLREDFTVKATWRLFRGRIDKRSRQIEILITAGRPNYAEREFIKNCKKSGEPFPVKKVQMKFLKKDRTFQN